MTGSITKYGFEWGAARIQRTFSDDKRGWVTLTLETPKYAGHNGLQIYVTRTGKVRIHDSRGEWSPPNKGLRPNGYRIGEKR
jgi:hypothetical protein